jgi:predicted transcriptional regulator
MSESKNNVAWEMLFEKHRILDELKNTDYFLISSSDINKFREARLMTKFDHKSQLPKIFTDNKLSILPVSRGTYIIGKFKTFYEFTQQDQNNTTTKKVEFPHFLESLNPEEITSEATAINCAFIAGILQDFTGEPNLYPTVSGRMSSSSFNFNIDLNENKELLQVKVNKSQIEIDGGYEGDNSLIIIEAKNYIPDDFLVRQLFYPYKLWIEKINKKVRPVFLTYINGIFHLREYIFTNNDYYNSIKLIRQQKYAIQEDSIINIEVIQNISNKAVIEKEPKIPFPQADYFERTINLCEILKQKSTLSKKEITQEYGFSSRQADYYSVAAVYLGLIKRGRENKISVYRLTERGLKLFELSIFDRKLELIALILRHEIFNQTLMLYFKHGNISSKKEVVEMMRAANLHNINSTKTYNRRSSTVIGWIKWIISLVEE